MLTWICQYLRNWFTAYEPKLVGTFAITANGVEYNNTDASAFFKTGQYVRVIGSTFNDGVHQWGAFTAWHPETFTGAIWGMAVPQEIIDLSEEIEAWCGKYAEAQNSPYTSESFAGYSYTKASGNASTGASTATWQDVFASRLAPWRKI